MRPLDLATAGALLYGERWQAAVARDLGVSREAVRLWVVGVHPVPDDALARLRELLVERWQAIGAALR
jgi:limonene-1,2-epoxide hydrolase